MLPTVVDVLLLTQFECSKLVSMQISTFIRLCKATVPEAPIATSPWRAALHRLPRYGWKPSWKSSLLETNYSTHKMKDVTFQSNADTHELGAHCTGTFCRLHWNFAFSALGRHVRKTRTFFSKYADHVIAKYAAKICGNRPQSHIRVNPTWYIFGGMG